MGGSHSSGSARRLGLISGTTPPLTTHIHTALTSKSRSEYRSFFLWKEQGGREGEESLLPHAGALQTGNLVPQGLPTVWA